MLDKDQLKNLVNIQPLKLNESLSAGIVGTTNNSINLGDTLSVDLKPQDFSWVNDDNNFYITKTPNCKTLPSGLYDIRYSDSGLFLQKRTVLLDELFELPDVHMSEVIKDLEKFWSSKADYEKYKMTYKRGILLYGPPGTGKSSLVNLLIHNITKTYNGLVINMDDLSSFMSFIPNLRFIEPEKPILATIEDLDSFLEYNSMKNFLNLLDGNQQIDNVTYLATTNYLDRIEDRVKNRPSRFDRRYEIGFPSEASRKFYLESKIHPEDLDEEMIDKWVADTDGLSFSHLKELIISVLVLKISYEEAITRIKNLQ